jgi:hypothetical protein
MGGTVLKRALVQASIDADQGLIDILEQVSDVARNERIMAAAIVLVRPDATMRSWISAPEGGRHHLVGACNYLKRDIIAQTDN